MIRHVALFQWKEGTTEAEIAAITAGLATLPDQIEALRAYRFGPDVGFSEGNFDYAVVADFDSIDDYPTYVQHPAHADVAGRLVRPHVEARASVQFAL
ncbi:MAG: Dabb family protein [Acidimicrobiia bacterium]